MSPNVEWRWQKAFLDFWLPAEVRSVHLAIAASAFGQLSMPHSRIETTHKLQTAAFRSVSERNY